MSGWGRNSDPVTCLRDGHQGNTSYQHQSTTEDTWSHISLCNIQNFPNPRRKHFSTYMHVLPIVTKEQRAHMRSIWLLPKRLSTLSKKTVQRLTLETDYLLIWGGRCPSWSVLPPDAGRKIAAVCCRKSADYQYITKSNQTFCCNKCQKGSCLPCKFKSSKRGQSPTLQKW